MTKILARDPAEFAMVEDAGVSPGTSFHLVIAAGVMEVALALALVAFWRKAWPPLVCIGLMILATAGVALFSPRFLTAAFNPVSLDLAVIALAVIDLLSLGGLPSGGTPT